MMMHVKRIFLFPLLFIAIYLPASAQAGLREESRIASSSLYCSKAAEIIGDIKDTDLFKKLGTHIIRSIYTRYSQGEISKSDMRADATAFMYMVIEPYDSISLQDVDIITEAVVNSFLNTGKYEKASEGKTGIEAFNAQRDAARESYEKWNCAGILDAIK